MLLKSSKGEVYALYKVNLHIYTFLVFYELFVSKSIYSRFILHAKKTAFIVEHDFLMGTYLADRVIVFEGAPSKSATANS